MKNIFTIIAIIALLGIGYMIISNNTQSTNIMNDENILLFTIAPEKEECVGVGPMQCLIVNGEYFYDSIDGFDFEEGYHYTIKVQRDERVNPPADASMYTYTLVEVVEKNLQQKILHSAIVQKEPRGCIMEEHFHLKMVGTRQTLGVILSMVHLPVNVLI